MKMLLQLLLRRVKTNQSLKGALKLLTSNTVLWLFELHYPLALKLTYFLPVAAVVQGNSSPKYFIFL